MGSHCTSRASKPTRQVRLHRTVLLLEKTDQPPIYGYEMGLIAQYTI